MRSLALWLLAVRIAAGQTDYSLLLRGGHLIDPKNNLDAVMDVAIRDGKVAAVAPQIDPARARSMVDLTGLYVTPGLVDMHVHVFHTTGIQGAWAGDNSVDPDSFSFRSGVTTMVDAGSSGWRNFETFYHTVIERAHTRVLAFINIAGLGMMADVTEQDPEDFQPEQIAKLARKYPEVVVGVKTAHYHHPDWTSVDRAVEAGRLSKLPVMVDFGWFRPERPYWQLVTSHLRPGDITTHVFRGVVPWVEESGENGKIYPYLLQARERGVKFDVGHGQTSFVFRNAVPAIEKGFWPDTISTDLHGLSMNQALCDMPTLLAKFLAMGMPLKEVVLRATWNPAQVIHHPEVGHLTAGSAADIAVWRVIEGPFGFSDSYGGRLEGRQRLVCEMTLKGGDVAWNWGALGLTDYRKLGPEYGLREGIDAIVRPPR